MSLWRKYSRGPLYFRREEPRFLGNAILIVTEGKKTEPNYLKALQNILKIAAAKIEILHPPFTDPLNLTSQAIKLRDERKKEALNKVGYDEVWVVFDLEKQHSPRQEQAREAMALAKAKGIKIADSNPCFEYWLLLHEKFTTASFADYEAVKKEFKRYWKNYDKGWTPPEEFLKKLPKAVTHAERCRKHHDTSTGGDRNPSTNVDFLARSLNNASRSPLL